MNPPTPKRPAYCLFSIGIAAALFFAAPSLSAQTVIGGDTIDVSAMLDVQGADKGVLLPRMTTAQRNAMPAPARGLLIFNHNENCIQINTGSPLLPVWKCLGEGLPQTGNQTGNVLYWNGTAWVRLSPGQPGQQLTLTQQGIPAWTGATFPVVSTAPITSINPGQSYFFSGVLVFEARVDVNIISDGGGPLLARGVVCDTQDNPVVPTVPVNSGRLSQAYGLSGAGIFTGFVTSLLPGTTYKCRGFAMNSAGIVYGNQQSFTTLPEGMVSGLNCAGATTSADLVTGKSPDDIVLTIPYTGGNGGVYAFRDTTSTGLTGLTASLAAGTLSLGPGSLQYVLTGTTPVAGTANFSISFGGQSCTVSRAVAPGAIAGLDCAGATFFNAELVAGKEANGVVSLPYSSGNGGSYAGQTIPSTGVSGLTATLWASNFADGSGTLTYSITGTPSAAGTANFALSIGGQSCTVSRAVLPGSITALDCAGATFSNAELVAGKEANGVVSLPYSGGNGGSHPGQTVASTGVSGLTATLWASNFADGSGTLTYSITGTPSAAGTANFALSIGGQSCTLSRAVVPGAIAGLDCAGATSQGELYQDFPSSLSVVPYTGGNGGSHPGQIITSTGVTGLTATLLPGNFALGSGTLTYTIAGTPSGAGTANFALSIGGRACTLSRTVLPSIFSLKDIPAGTFSMGCTPGDPDCGGNESPVHTVTLSAFLMGETEVTQAQWQTVMGSNPSYFSSCAQCPVEQVSWYDAVVFCNRLSELQGLGPCYFADAAFTQVYGKSGGSWSLPNSGEVYRNPSAKGYRLPTEAEWEYAARGGSATNIYAGSNNIDEVAWYGGNNYSWVTKPVKGKLANGYGLYDMSGNVWEWCQDWYGSYSADAQTNPVGPSSGDYRVLRGGSGSNRSGLCRVSYRFSHNPSLEDYLLGFRVARQL